MSLRDRMRIDDVRRELDMEKITSKVRTAGLLWYGHVKGMKDSIWVKY